MKWTLNQKYYWQSLRFFLSHPRFKLTFVLMILFGLYASFLLPNTASGYLAYLPALERILENRTFSFLLLLLIILNTSQAFHTFSEDNARIIRYQNKKNYFFETIKMLLFYNISVIFIQFLIVLTGLNIFCSFDLGYGIYTSWQISNLVYILFIFFRKVFLLMILSILVFVSFHLFERAIVMLISCLWGVNYFNGGNLLGFLDDRLPFKIGMESYLGGAVYDSFLEETLATFLYLFLAFTLVSFFIKWAAKRVRRIAS